MSEFNGLDCAIDTSGWAHVGAGDWGTGEGTQPGSEREQLEWNFGAKRKLGYRKRHPDFRVAPIFHLNPTAKPDISGNVGFGRYGQVGYGG